MIPDSFRSAKTDNVAVVYNFFRNRGLSPEVCVGIIGNLQQESSPSINPALKQANNGPGRGIAQWNIPPHGERFTSLENFARQRGTPWDDLNTQLEFMWKEMILTDISRRMQGNQANVAQRYRDAFQNNLNRKGAIALPNGFQDFIVLRDIEQAVRMFDAAYHRSGTPMMERRIEFANSAWNRFLAESNADTGVSDWAEASWNWAIENVLTDGTRPRESATRQEFVTMLYRYYMRLL